MPCAPNGNPPALSMCKTSVRFHAKSFHCLHSGRMHVQETAAVIQSHVDWRAHGANIGRDGAQTGTIDALKLITLLIILSSLIKD